jgi:hypothetical protein
MPPPRLPTGLSVPYAVLPGTGGNIIYEYLPGPDLFNNHGDPAIIQADLQLLFWGAFWENATGPSTSDIENAVKAILDGPYLSELGQYGFQSLNLRPSLIVTDPGPNFPTYSDDDANNMVWSLIDDGKFPEPDDDGGNIVYMIFAPKGTQNSNASESGAHDDDTDTDLFEKDHAPVGWINYGSLDAITQVFSHELVETITDPIPPEGWCFDRFPLGQAEACDRLGLARMTGLSGNIVVEPYFSKRLGSFVIPDRPRIRLVSLNERDSQIGDIQSTTQSVSAVTKPSSCFKRGTNYGWTLVTQASQVVLAAEVSTFVSPSMTWFINGSALRADPPSPGVLVVDSSLEYDPLSSITQLPPEQTTVTFYMTDKDTKVVFNVEAGQAPAVLKIELRVQEASLDQIYDLKRETSTQIWISGRTRTMDRHFTNDANTCLMNKLKALSEKLIVPGTVINTGDPYPDWSAKWLGSVGISERQSVVLGAFLVQTLSTKPDALVHQADQLVRLNTAIALNARAKILGD